MTFLERLVGVFEGARAMALVIVLGFLQSCLGLFQMPDSGSDFRMALPRLGSCAGHTTLR